MEIEAVRRRSVELLQLVGLLGEDRRISGFSRGMKQRLGIAQALLGEPRLFICDEPTSALDPLGRRDILDILKQVSAHTTVLFSTHVLADVERICDHVGLLDGGRLIPVSYTHLDVYKRQVQIDAAGQDLSVIVIRVISADLRTAGGGKKFKILLTEYTAEALRHMQVAFLIGNCAGFGIEFL